MATDPITNPNQYATMELKNGYKQTEVGVIPEDWEVKSVGEISEVKSGKRLPLGKKLLDEITHHPYIRVTDMIWGGVDLREIKFVPEDVFPLIKNYRIYKEDIFISVAGTLGIVGKLPEVLDGANLTENADKLTSIKCDRDYLLYILMSPLVQNTIESERTLGAQPKLALIRIRNFQIPLPPSREEQTAIATALSDTDALISRLEALIAKKRAIKQGAMQQLLKPKEGWEVKKLEEIAEIRSGKRLPLGKSLCEEETPHPYIRILDMTESGISLDEIRYVPEEVFPSIKNYRIFKEDIYISIAGTLGLVGRIPEVLDGANLTENANKLTHITCDVNYLLFVLKSDLVQGKIISERTLGAQPKLALVRIRNFEIPLPANEEQTRIAKILSDMDAEITGMEQKLAKYKLVKQGMMQELLTGKTRLV